jgi:hypothetical protein
MPWYPSLSDFGSSPPIISETSVAWFFGLIAASFILKFLVRHTTNASDRQASIIAYNLTAMAPNIVQLAFGARLWFSRLDEFSGGDTRHSRLYTPLEGGATFNISVCIAYELWNTCTALLLPDYRTLAFVGHHVSSLYLLLLTSAPFLHFYSLFFFGPPALSNLFLSGMDCFKHCEPMQRAMPAVNLAFRVGFAVSFLATRTVYWAAVSARFWRDVVETLAAGEAHSTWVLGVYMASNVFLTGLQALWASKVIDGLRRQLFGTAGEKQS